MATQTLNKFETWNLRKSQKCIASPKIKKKDKAISCPSVSTSSITRFWSRSILSGHASGVVHLGGAGLPCSFLLASVGPYCQPLFVCFLETAPILAVGGS